MQAIDLAFDFALLRAGKSMPARMAMMAITTRSSISVKPFRKKAPADTPRSGVVTFVFITFSSFWIGIDRFLQHFWLYAEQKITVFLPVKNLTPHPAAKLERDNRPAELIQHLKHRTPPALRPHVWSPPKSNCHHPALHSVREYKSSPGC